MAEDLIEFIEQVAGGRTRVPAMQRWTCRRASRRCAPPGPVEPLVLVSVVFHNGTGPSSQEALSLLGTPMASRLPTWAAPFHSPAAQLPPLLVSPGFQRPSPIAAAHLVR